MAKSYSEEAIELCRRLYCKYGGKNHDAIQREMRAAGYSGWSKINLQNRGREGPRGERMGWVDKYGFDNSLRLHIEKLATSVNNDEQDLYLSIKTLRKRLQGKALARNPDTKVVSQFRDLAKLEIEARRNLDLSRSNLETFAEAFELIATWAPDIDADLASRFIKSADRFMELAQAHYGKQEDSVNDGTGDGPDEGRDGESEDEDSFPEFFD